MEVNKDQLADILGKSCAILLSDVNIFEEHYYIDVIRDMFDRTREGANKRGNSSRLTQSFHFFMFEPIFSPVNALNQPI
ncbi:hypothetical protein KHZ70_13530 [Escherichia coli]|uniref:hypothetical protein n=5 Tax=Escherichia coli TaxID=562 RepID=UPI001BD00AA5|nr:hypothetical protein [Escherichia coli]MDF0438136.1 hypothetical protein [Escherichia coli]MDZ8859712.1 hypothetical protein [Escherichia coli]MDZ9405271.1 hypothetical protein [Escherichia coli]MDZ9464424.1 hypothetical protein [Escherichia coli]QVK43671.1 hypothetical protein KHZ70_13530 [Escherichia coli]